MKLTDEKPKNSATSKLTLQIVMGVALLQAAFCAAEPRVEYLSPPSFVRGEKNSVTFVGSQVDRPIGIWTSLPPGKFNVVSSQSTDAEHTTCVVEPTADCPLGLYGLRLATADGLSNLQLFLVDDMPLRPLPTEPPTQFPLAIAGEFRKAEVDRFPLRVEAGRKLAFDVVASRFGTDADPLITIYNAAGRRVARHDNDPGLFFDCRFEHTFAAASDYVVEIRDARYGGSPHWRYVLRIGDFPAARVVVPSSVRPGETTLLNFPELGAETSFTMPSDAPLGRLLFSWRRPGDNASSWVTLLNTASKSVVEVEPPDGRIVLRDLLKSDATKESKEAEWNKLLQAATHLESLPALAHGTLNEPADLDAFSLELKKGDKLAIRAVTQASQSAADVELVVFDPTGKEIQRNDDLSLPGGAIDESLLNFTAGQDGKYCVLVREVSGSGGPAYSYRLEIEPVTPRIQVAAGESSLTIPQESYQMLPLTVTRTDYAGPIELSLRGGPPEVKLEPSIIPAGENELVCRVVAPQSTPLGIYTLTVEAKSSEGENPISTFATFQPLIDKEDYNVDLIKTALRENQRRLPPSVHDRLALQITPPSPYGVEPASDKVTLPRYQYAEFPLQIPRTGGFTGDVAFTAVSAGQLGEESQGRRQVFARIPTAASGASSITASVHSRSQANEGKERVNIVAVSKQGDRSITLTRSFLLTIQPAYDLTLEPLQAVLLPGESIKVKLSATRLPSFTGPITVDISQNANAPPGITFPESIVIAPGATSAEIDIVVSPDYKPRRERIRFTAVATVGGFQEELRPRELDLDVKAMKDATKK